MADGVIPGRPFVRAMTGRSPRFEGCGGESWPSFAGHCRANVAQRVKEWRGNDGCLRGLA